MTDRSELRRELTCDAEFGVFYIADARSSATPQRRHSDATAAVMPSEYQTAVITCAAVLGIKTVVVALATVRARIMSSTFNFKNPEATNLLGALFDKSGLLLTFINNINIIIKVSKQMDKRYK